MVASNTLQRYPETFDLAASAVNNAIKAATMGGVDLFAEVSQLSDIIRSGPQCQGAEVGIKIVMQTRVLHPTQDLPTALL